MTELFTILGDVLKSINPFMAVMVIVYIIMLYMFKDSIIEKIKSIKLKNLFNRFKEKKDNRKIVDLVNHDIFNTCNRVDREISFMKFYTNGEYDATKTKMCIDFANHKVRVCKVRFKNFLSKDIDKVSYDELKSIILEDMTSIHEEYIEDIKKFWLKKGIKLEDVNYVIALFERFRYDVIVSFQHRIDAIFATEYYNSNFDKVLACYDTFAMGIDLLPKDMLITFEALNGKFKSIKYDNEK
ncbi:MAG: hypothetical protein ACOVK2_02905 [Candidatus Fonsibacter sp.]